MFAAIDPAEASTDAGTGVFPPMTVTQDEDNFYLRAEVPGMNASDLSITAVNNRLSISGKREIPKERERVSYHRKERAEGAFDRTVTLPANVEAERVQARYTDGILTLTLPKAEQTKPRQIVVNT
jgi:HSP20 family protein